MSDPSSSSHSLYGPAPNRSLASYAPVHPPTSPFSTQQLTADAANGLAPPSLLAQRSSALYPTSGFEQEQHVYRSVAVEAPQIGGSSNVFDPFDQSNVYHHASTGVGKELSLDPKNSYSYASYQPTLNFSVVNSHPSQSHSPLQFNPTSQQVKTVSAIDSTSQLTPPPQAPIWLEPNSHFFCTCPAPSSTPAHLYDTVQSVLQSLHEGVNGANGICTLDMTPKPDRYKLNCTAYQRHSGAATPFIVRIFTSNSSANKFCVEFQRRQGDIVLFYELFRTARTRIQSAYPCADEKQTNDASLPSQSPSTQFDALNLQSLDSSLSIPQLSLRSWSAPPLPVESGSSFSKDHMCETVRSLLAMCSSSCLDIKLQGVLALADLSCTNGFDQAMKSCSFDMREALVAEGCFQLFLDCLPHDHAELHRASLMALANIVEAQSHLCKQVVSDEKSLTRLYVLTGSQTHQVVRECGRFLSACASTLGPDLWRIIPQHHQPVFQQTVQRLSQHSDEHCRQHANTINKCILGTA